MAKNYPSVSYTFLVYTSFFFKESHLSCCKQHFRLKSDASEQILNKEDKIIA